MAIIKVIITVLLVMIAFSSCKKDNPVNNSEPAQEETLDALAQFENLGKWEIQSRLVNNISGMPGLCCEFVVFTPDANTNDSIGQFTYTSAFDSIAGTFEVFQPDSLLIFRDNDTHIRYFRVHENAISLRYTEDGDSIDEIWVK